MRIADGRWITDQFLKGWGVEILALTMHTTRDKIEAALRRHLIVRDGRLALRKRKKVRP